MTKQNIIKYEKLMAAAADGHCVEVGEEIAKTASVRVQLSMFDCSYANIINVRVNSDGSVEYYLNFWCYGWFDRNQFEVSRILGKCRSAYFDRLLNAIKDKVSRMKVSEVVTAGIKATEDLEEAVETGKAIAHKRMLELSRPVVVTQVGMSRFTD